MKTEDELVELIFAYAKQAYTNPDIGEATVERLKAFMAGSTAILCIEGYDHQIVSKVNKRLIPMFLKEFNL